MSSTLKLSGALRVGKLSADPANPEEGLIYYNTTTGKFKQYENGSFRTVSAEAVEAHLTQDANLKHLDTEIDYSRADGSRKNIQADATSANVGAAINDLDDAIGALAASPTNYTPGNAAIVASHLAAIDTALASAGGTTFADDVFRIQDNADATKQIAFEASNIATATTRTITMPNSDVSLGDIATNTSAINGHLGGGANKHDASEIDVEIVGNNHSISDLETVIGELDTAIGDLSFVPSNYSDPASDVVAAHLANIDTALGLRALDADVIKKDGSVAFTGNQSMGGNKLTGLGTPTADTDAATKAYVDAIKQGLDVKDSVRAASTANVALSGGASLSIDGVSLANGDRVLLKDQSTGSENGIYDVSGIGSAYSLTRSADADADAEVTAGMFTFVTEGTVNADSGWILTTNDPIVVDTTALAFSQFSGAGQITAGDGLTKTGSQLDVGAGDGISVGADTVSVDGTVTRADGSVAFTADQSMGSNKITNLAAGTAAGDAVNKTQLDAKIGSLVEDTTPQLGGNLDANGNAYLDSLKRGTVASPSNLVQEDYVDSISLSASQTNAVIAALTFAHASFEGCEIVYKIKEATSNDVRIGTLRVVTNGTNVVLNDVSTETADVGITFDAVVNGTDINIRYSSGTNGATMRADVKKIRA